MRQPRYKHKLQDSPGHPRPSLLPGCENQPALSLQGDIHNIGKDIVISQLEADGFEVYDLGINVPQEKFIDKIKETDANIVVLSGLIT